TIWRGYDLRVHVLILDPDEEMLARTQSAWPPHSEGVPGSIAYRAGLGERAAELAGTGWAGHDGRTRGSTPNRTSRESVLSRLNYEQEEPLDRHGRARLDSRALSSAALGDQIYDPPTLNRS
ncbi:hypothetical protein, partial [Streptomyces sp. AJS327]|uniref:hypothetical protein n=1 Tax=Streptomyces sp. AJS327 TaxID=2545265 RepID=UPI001C609F7B